MTRFRVIGSALAALALSAAFTFAAAPASASAAIYIQERYGSQAVGNSSGLALGSYMTEVGKPGRVITYTAKTTYLGYGAGTLQVSNGYYLATDGSSCNFVILKASGSATGVIWALHIATDGSQYWINRACDQAFGSPGTQVLAGHNVNGARLGICGSPFNCSGWFRAMFSVAA